MQVILKARKYHGVIDMMPEEDSDSESLKTARAEIFSTIQEWLKRPPEKHAEKSSVVRNVFEDPTCSEEKKQLNIVHPKKISIRKKFGKLFTPTVFQFDQLVDHSLTGGNTFKQAS